MTNNAIEEARLALQQLRRGTETPESLLAKARFESACSMARELNRLTRQLTGVQRETVYDITRGFIQ